MKKFLMGTLLLISASSIYAQSLFEGVMVRGVGCPQGKFSLVMAPDNRSFSILFDQFQAALPKTSTLNDNQEAVAIGALPAQFRNAPMVELKMCTISFHLNLPGQTRTHELEVTHDYRGYLYLDQGLGAFFKSYMFQVAVNPHGGHSGGQSHSNILIEDNIYKAPYANLDQDLTITKSRRIRINSVPRIKAVGGKQVYINQVFMGFKNIVGVHSLSPSLNSNIVGQLTIDSSDITGKMTVKLISSK